MSFHVWMDNENMVNIHNDMLLNCKEKQNNTFAGKLMELGNIILCELIRSQKKKETMRVLSLL